MEEDDPEDSGDHTHDEHAIDGSKELPHDEQTLDLIDDLRVLAGQMTRDEFIEKPKAA